MLRICRSHICHQRMLITVNPFTSRKAGLNTARAATVYLYPLVPKSHHVFYTAQFTLCQLCFLTISHCELPSVCVAPPANPLPASAKMRALLKQSYQLTFLALETQPALLPLDRPLISTKRLCRNPN